MLGALGLGADEQAVYEALVSGSPATRPELLALHSGDDAWAVRLDAVLATLLRLGLVDERPGTAPPSWSAVPPDTGLDALVLRRTVELVEARRRLLELQTRFERAGVGRQPSGMAEVLDGRTAIGQAFEAIQRGARHEVCTIDAPPYADPHSPGRGKVHNSLELELLAGGICYRVLYDRHALDRPGRLSDLVAGIEAGETARVTDVPMKLALNDNGLALAPLSSGPRADRALLVHEPNLLAALRALFELSWENALPLQAKDGLAQLSGPDRPEDDERDLLRLLVAGLSDRAIAGQLGWSDRTVRRHVQSLMSRLHASTRFQAGYQAVLRGWLGDRIDSVDVGDGRGTP